MPCFNRRLRQLRDEAGLSQQELSNQTGITKSSINMYERGEREPGLETLEVLADYFNVDMDYLIGYQSKKHITSSDGVFLTEHERAVIAAYRTQLPVQAAVDKLLKIAPETDRQVIPMASRELWKGTFEKPSRKLADNSFAWNDQLPHDQNDK